MQFHFHTTGKSTCDLYYYYSTMMITVLIMMSLFLYSRYLQNRFAKFGTVLLFCIMPIPIFTTTEVSILTRKWKNDSSYHYYYCYCHCHTHTMGIVFLDVIFLFCFFSIVDMHERREKRNDITYNSVPSHKKTFSQ